MRKILLVLVALIMAGSAYAYNDKDDYGRRHKQCENCCEADCIEVLTRGKHILFINKCDQTGTVIKRKELPRPTPTPTPEPNS